MAVTVWFAVLLCFSIHKTESSISSSLNSTNVSLPLSATPSLDSLNMTLNVSYTDSMLETINQSMNVTPSMDFNSCMIMPSTCICNHSSTVSVMSEMVNMSSSIETTIVNMTMTSSADISGSLTSYMVPASSSINATATNFSMSNFSTSDEHYNDTVPCTCYGQYTACDRLGPGYSWNNNNNNNNNNEVASSVSVSLTSPVPVNSLVSPSQLLLPSGSQSLSMPDVSMTQAVPNATTLVPSAAMNADINATAIAPSVAPTLPPVCITDCQGVPCGTAIVNSCGKCVKGTTGLEDNHWKDCNNVCNGTARNDTCGACTNPPLNDPTGKVSPFSDCHGTCFGSAGVDSCGNCSGGLTGKAVDFRKDGCGICGGDNSSCLGCDGVLNSSQVNDSCNVCDGDGSTCTTITMVSPNLMPTTSVSSRVVRVYGAGLDGSSIQCFLDGVPLTVAGTLVDRTHCECTIPNDQTAGSKSFTVKVVKGGGNVPTADLPIMFYDAVNTKITSLAPAEVFTSETTVVTFGGTGLLEHTDAACMVNGTKIPAVFSSGSYNCTLPSYANSKQVTVALSLNGVHELASDVALIRTVYARPPTLNSARFSDPGALINVEFSKDCATSSLTSCSNIFDAASLPRLGTSPGCSWSDARHLIISPAADASISPNDPLTLKANAVKSGGEQHAKYATASINVQAPLNPVKPVPVIVGPTQISKCGDLSLDGGQSSGGGGRDLKFTWSLVSASKAAITAVLDAAKNKTKVFINGTLMTAGSYTFRLEVENFLNSTGVHSDIIVTKATTPLPEVTINGPFEGKALAASTFYITAVAKAASCSSSKTLIYTWSVTSSSADAKTRAESSSGFRETSSKSVLKIDSGSLVGGMVYNFTVVVALKTTPLTATTVYITVTAEWSALEPAITGGDRTVGRDSGSLVLDGESSTVDPDNAGGDLVCSWICEDMSINQPCYSAVNKQNKIPFPNQCRITIASVEFAAERSYKIKCEVSKGSRTGQSSILVTVVAGTPPAVSVVTPRVKVVAGEKVELNGKYTSSIKPTVGWVCAQEESYRYIDLADASLISSSSEMYNANGESFFVKIIKANILTPGASYKFILNVNDGSKVGSSNMIVEVRSGPTSGSFEASPTTLEQLKTVTLTAPRWVTDSDANPLKYEFGFVKDNGIFQPWVTQTSNEYSIAVPSGSLNNKLTLRLKVKDAFGSVQSMDKEITVTVPLTINEAVVENLIDGSLQQAQETGDYSKAVANMMNVLDVVIKSNSSSNLTSKVLNSTENGLISAVAATSLDEQTAKPMLQCFLKLPATSLKDAKDVLDSFEKIVEGTNENLGGPTVEETLNWMSKLTPVVNLGDQDVVKDVTAIYTELGKSVAKDVDLGQTAVEASSDDVVIKAEHTFLAGNIATKTASSTQVEFGNEMRGKFGYWECASGKFCLGVKLIFVNYKKDYYTQISSSKPAVLTDKVVNIVLQNPETGSSVPISGLTTPATLTFDTGAPSAGKTFTAYYYNEVQKMWSADGLTSSMQSSTLKATTNHFTSFAPAEEVALVTTPSPSSNVSTVAAPSENIFQLSFVLSNTSWNESLLNSSHPQYKALEDAILRALNEVYKNDPTLKDIVLDKFEKSGDLVKVLLKMTFDASNENPGDKLKASLANGSLGSIAVDKDSIKWVDTYAQYESDDGDDTEVIIGTVFGVFFGLAIILLVAAWLKKRQSRRKVGSSHPSISEEPADAEESQNIDDTPA